MGRQSCIVLEVQRTDLRERLYQRCHILIHFSTFVHVVSPHFQSAQLAAQIKQSLVKALALAAMHVSRKRAPA